MWSAHGASENADLSRAEEAEKKSKAASRPLPSASRRRARKEKRSRVNPSNGTRRARLSASELHRFALQVLAQRLERRGDDAFGVQAGLGIHRRGRVLVYEDVGQNHGAHFEAAVEHAVGGERVPQLRGKPADGAFLDGDEPLVLAREPKEQFGIERLGEARVGNRG